MLAKHRQQEIWPVVPKCHNVAEMGVSKTTRLGFDAGFVDIRGDLQGVRFVWRAMLGWHSVWKSP